ncbi:MULTISPECIES: hypothetical protein [unclassified Afipia]|uniref:hypothetical protein n=1 Tax=unclassified Afipia TaxID=2642050 RepID=UPI00040031BE|nr:MULTISPECIES: hypothetical protein [unclassified Afipia]
MIRIVNRLAAVLSVALLVPLNAQAQDQRFDITVTADATKTNGSPWDGVPRLGNSKLNLNAAPDIAVCLVRANAKPECLWRPQGRRLLSMCQNALTCKFDNVALAPLPIGLVFVDIDARNHDIIDVAVLTDRTDAKANEDIADSLRTAMSVLTPHRSEDTKERLVRGAKLLALADCAGGKPCRLTQSQFVLTRR